MEIKQLANSETVNLALDTVGLGKQALVFAESKMSAEKAAEEIAKKIKDVSLDELSEQVLKSLSSPTKQCRRLSFCIKKGIAFHHAGLVAKQRELIEDAFRRGEIKIICATPTLAMGIDLPAFRVINKSLRRYSGRWGMNWLPVLEVYQMWGRAGRPKFHDDYGEAIAIAKTSASKDEIRDRYVYGEVEDIYSKLAVEPVLRTYLLSLIATGFIRNKNQILEFFSKTFWAHQYKDLAKLEMILMKMLNLLEEYEFVKISEREKGFTLASNLESGEVIRATPLGRRVVELYIDPYTANHLIKGIKRASSRRFGSFSLLQLISHTLEMRPLLRVKVKEYEDIQERLAEHYDQLLENEPVIYDPIYDEFMNSIKTALFLEEWIDEKTEEELLEKYNVRPGEIRVKLGLGDWLLYAAEELTRLLQFREVLQEILKLRVRLKNGVKEELLPLLKLKGVGRVRARKLFRNGVKDLGGVKKADIVSLSQILGKSVAVSIKRQMGEDVVEVPKGRRKGQLGLKKF
ncbi:helicase-related protein [Nanoarchaeota archaeon]